MPFEIKRMIENSSSSRLDLINSLEFPCGKDATKILSQIREISSTSITKLQNCLKKLRSQATREDSGHSRPILTPRPEVSARNSKEQPGISKFETFEKRASQRSEFEYSPDDRAGSPSAEGASLLQFKGQKEIIEFNPEELSL